MAWCVITTSAAVPMSRAALAAAMTTIVTLAAVSAAMTATGATTTAEAAAASAASATAASTTAATTAVAATATATAVATATAAVTTAAATTAAVATAAATTTATATRTRRALAGLVHRQGPTIDLLPGEGRDRGLQTVVGLHFHESETTRPAGFTIGDHFGAADGAVGSKHRLEIGGRGGPGEVPHVNLPSHRNQTSGNRELDHQTKIDSIDHRRMHKPQFPSGLECGRESVELAYM